MYLFSEQAERVLENLTKNMEQDFEEKLQFITELLKDDDWSFVIKSHALIESLITELIIIKIDEPNLKEIVERMPLHGETISKISILKQYDLIPKDHFNFLRKLSEIRNQVVHRYENIDFTFKDYVTNLDKNNKKNWKRMLIWPEMDESYSKLINKNAYENPKVAVWMTFAMFASNSLQAINLLKGKNKIDKVAMKTTKELLKKYDS